MIYDDWPAEKPRPKLSAVIVARDEEELLPGCIDSMFYTPVYDDWPEKKRPIYDELVVVVAAESTDRTRELARKAGAKVGTFGPWPIENGAEVRDYAELRNYAESLCSGDYIYWQDADERLVAGHELIRDVVDKGEEDAVQPMMVWSRDEYGNVERTYARQHLLHKRGVAKWSGKVHEWTDLVEGAKSRVDPGILHEQRDRKDGDRSHGDIFETLRANFSVGITNERHLFYLAREHAYVGHWAEAIGLLDIMLAGKAEWPMQRSSAAMLKGDGLAVLGRHEEAREAYIRAIREWGAWAEPYYAVGKLHYDLGQWCEGAAWLAASCLFDKPADGSFTNDSIYQWRRYDLLAVCLSKIGRQEEAHKYGEMALAARPDDERLKKNMEFY